MSVERFLTMPSRRPQAGAVLLAYCLFAPATFAQTAAPSPPDTVRVNVTLNADGSRTIYEFDSARHKATATTTDSEGKPRGKIQYQLDESGRFSTGRIFGADGQFRFTSTYKYDGGRLQQETQSGKDGAILSKIVYAYDTDGKQTGYSIYDAAGKLIDRKGSVPGPSPSATKKPRRTGK